MRPSAVTLDPEWESRYRGGLLQRYPWDHVVSFVFRHAPRDRPPSDVAILEIGCGSASNLWFAAREGFNVAGIDGSPTAISWARRRFAEDGLAGELVVGDFTRPLPFAAATFDLAIDRGAIVCVTYSAGRHALREIWRTLRPGGLFLFNPYSQEHTSYLCGAPDAEGFVREVMAGALVGTGPLCFYDEAMVRRAVADDWELVSLSHVTRRTSTGDASPLANGAEVHAEWTAILRKPEDALRDSGPS